jgi:hypothetical protein
MKTVYYSYINPSARHSVSKEECKIFVDSKRIDKNTILGEIDTPFTGVAITYKRGELNINKKAPSELVDFIYQLLVEQEKYLSIISLPKEIIDKYKVVPQEEIYKEFQKWNGHSETEVRWDDVKWFVQNKNKRPYPKKK